MNDAACVGVERIFAGTERPLPDSSLALRDPLAVAECITGDIAPRLADVTYHDSDVADRHDRLGDRLDRGEPAVDEVGAVGER